MKLITEVEIPSPGIQISYSDSLLMVGSCFANSIGSRFAQHKFNTSVNPFGVLYNPVSVLQLLKYATGMDSYAPQDLVLHQGLWHSMAHHGSFSSIDKDVLEHGLQKTDVDLKQKFEAANWLFVTWGTAWVYRYNQTGRIVANCHKIPASEFQRFRLTVDEIVLTYSSWLAEVLQQCPNLKVVLTVSPVRHLKDSAHGNQLSKAILLLAAEALAGQFQQVTYFPSYEIVLDELRDYRFYAEDMTHPNEVAVNYIWEKLKKHWLSEDTQGIMKEVSSVVNAAHHRPFNAHTAVHQKFIKNTLAKIETLKGKQPTLNFSREVELLTRQIIQT